jgi:hypothetical protein
MTISLRLRLAVVAALLLCGCAEFPGFDKTAPRSPGHPKAASAADRDASPREAARARARERERDAAPAPAKDADPLAEGIKLYNEGDFNGAIRRLSVRELNSGPLPARLTALKYTAFSYCVTACPAQCRQAFDKALRLDPAFDLAPGEQGHPLWGPVFTRAKQSVAAR